jgi:uncharacterized membrane protein
VAPVIADVLQIMLVLFVYGYVQNLAQAYFDEKAKLSGGNRIVLRRLLRHSLLVLAVMLVLFSLAIFWLVG